jgi:outer membrane protein insertion porin family
MVPVEPEAIIAEIQLRFIDAKGQPTPGKTRPYVFEREFDLAPGDRYDPALAQAGLQRLTNLGIVKAASLTLEPAQVPDQVVMVITIEEQRAPFFFTFALTLPHPSALQGPARPVTVLPADNRANGLSSGVRFGSRNLGGNDQVLSLGIVGGQRTLGLDLDFRDPLDRNSGYGINVSTQRGVETEFVEGERQVDLPSGSNPWVIRLGGGTEYFWRINPDLKAAVGISYQNVSVRSGAFSSRLEPVDELGNPLTVSSRGQDDLLTVNFAAAFNRLDDTLYPTRGGRLLFGMDQSIPIGDANILFNRLTANYTQYIPVNFFGFGPGPQTLVLNLQGGTTIGDVPPYEAFNLGGDFSVRGYLGGDVGSGRSFLQGTAEYRFPIFGFTAFKEQIPVGGTLFVDYATTLGSQNSVIGEPGVVREKPGQGLGGGFGLRASTPLGPFRLELGFTDQGDVRVIFNVGDRF